MDTESLKDINDVMRAVAERKTELVDTPTIFDGWLIVDTTDGEFWFDIDGKIMQVL